MGDFTPTDEQVAAVDCSLSGKSLAVEALAGTGKTSTLRLIADAKSNESGLYLAFNKSIVTDAEGSFPESVECRTSHSMAFRPVGLRYKHRLNSSRMKGQQMARFLGVDSLTFDTPMGSKRLAGGFLASMVMRGIERFCTTADEKPGWWHIPTPDTMRDDEVLMGAWRQVQQELAPAIEDAWEDIVDENGKLRFTHNCYLKIWQLSRPVIEKDFILFDEAQDANPVTLAIVEAQREHAQLIFVGDRHQQIFGWNGAVNAMEKAPVEERTYLTNSFRFGPEIAGKANEVLAKLGDVKITGLGAAGTVGDIDEPDIVLSRTNAVAVRRAMKTIDAGDRPHIVGGASDVVRFAEGAKTLQEQGWTSNPELVCFESWTEVQEYVKEDELGRDLALLVRLVDEYGADRIVSTFKRQPGEADADIILSTAHKSKGREWDAVQLADDFPDGKDEVAPEEQRLLYVAATRAMSSLDVTRVGVLNRTQETEKETTTVEVA
jgi:superfamily I DNA/RNA helicase